MIKPNSVNKCDSNPQGKTTVSNFFLKQHQIRELFMKNGSSSWNLRILINMNWTLGHDQEPEQDTHILVGH